MLGTEDEYKKQIILSSLSNQKSWKGSIVSRICLDPIIYYKELLKYSLEHYMLYPYHLSDVLLYTVRIAPFHYYLEMFVTIMKNEKSYDSLPNFTAADGVRLLGVGRNQYIDMMNKYRSKTSGALWKKKKVLPIEMLPTGLVDPEIEYWWTIGLGFISDDDFQNCTPNEKSIIDNLRGEMPAGKFDRASVISLYCKHLIYVMVPINDDDHIAMPPLEGFVMNRVLGDNFEKLLYKIFVSIDERTTMSQLANLLEIDVKSVKDAVSIYCRLGFAKKKNIDSIENYEASWLQAKLQQNEKKTLSQQQQNVTFFSTNQETQQMQVLPSNSSLTIDNNNNNNNNDKRIGFVFDSTLTAFLMMGNLSQGLKNHAVTLFEVGKLSDEALDSFLNELDKADLRLKEYSEGDATRYFDHAIVLRNSLRFLRKNNQKVDMIRCESMNALDHKTRVRLLDRSYSLLISIAPVASETRPLLSAKPVHFGPPLFEACSSWFKLFLYSKIGIGPPSIFLVKGTRLTSIPKLFSNCEKVLLCVYQKDCIVVNIATLLVHVNDALQTSPVLLQVFLTNENRPMMADVPFPIDPVRPCGGQIVQDEISTISNEFMRLNPTCTLELHTNPVVLNIIDTLKLQYSFGYIRMVYTTCDLDGNLLSNPYWSPLEIVYGMPLFDSVINQAVCDAINNLGLLSPTNLRKQSFETRRLCIAFLDFVCNKITSSINISQPQQQQGKSSFSNKKENKNPFEDYNYYNSNNNDFDAEYEFDSNTTISIDNHILLLHQ